MANGDCGGNSENSTMMRREQQQNPENNTNPNCVVSLQIAVFERRHIVVNVAHIRRQVCVENHAAVDWFQAIAQQVCKLVVTESWMHASARVDTVQHGAQVRQSTTRRHHGVLCVGVLAKSSTL